MTTSTTHIPVYTKQTIDSHVHCFSLSTLQDIDCNGRVRQHLTQTDLGTLSSVNNNTITAAGLYGGLLKFKTGQAITCNLDTAANIINAVPDAKDGDYFDCLVTNYGSGNTVTIQGGTGSTINCDACCATRSKGNELTLDGCC